MTRRLATICLMTAVLIGVSSLVIVLFASVAWTQERPKKYPWQYGDTSCDKTMSFCWHSSDVVFNPQVIVYGSRWVSQDKEQKPLEWVTQVRCVQELHVCVLARNQKVLNGSETNADLYRIQEWSNYQIRAIGESDRPRGKECEIDSLLLNRAEASVSMLSVPGPAATTKACVGIVKPKTVIYKLEIGPPTL
jgi:hypothetical protein